MITFNLDKCLEKHINAFKEDPFCFFTEAEAVSAISSSLRKQLPQKVKTADGHRIVLVHQEYRSFFKLQNGKRQGHYDIVVLNPQFVETQNIKSLAKSRIVKQFADRPFLCVIEVKLFYQSISKQRAFSIIQDLEKLEATSSYSSIVSFVHFQRYLRSNEKQWSKYWPDIEKKARSCRNVLSTFAIYREYTNAVEVIRYPI